MSWNIEVEEPTNPDPGDTYQMKIIHPLTCSPVLEDGRPVVEVSGGMITFYYQTRDASTDTEQWDTGVLIGTPTTFNVTCVLDGNKKPPVHKEKVDVAGGGGGGPRLGFVGSFRLPKRKKRYILVPSRLARAKK